VVDVGFVGLPHVLCQLRKIVVELLAFGIEPRVEIAVPMIERRKLVGPTAAQSYLDMLCAPHDKAPQDTVKVV